MFKCCNKPKGKQTYNAPPIGSIPNDFTDFELDVLELINYHRHDKGLQMLKFSFDLKGIAVAHCDYMIGDNKASHNNFQIRNAQAIIHLNATWLGECVGYGYGTPAGVVNSWIGSKTHAAVLESKRGKHFAIAIKQNSKGRNYFTFLMIN